MAEEEKSTVQRQTCLTVSRLPRPRRGGVTLPIELVEKLGWREKQKVVVVLKGRTILIRDWRPASKRK